MKAVLGKQEKLKEALRFQVLSGQLRPGDRLPAERTLGQLNGISRVTVRGALEALEAEGYVERLPRRGIVVKGTPKPTPSPRALASPMKRKIGCVFFPSLPEDGGGHFSLIFRGVSKYFKSEDGFTVDSLAGGVQRLTKAEISSYSGFVVGGTRLDMNLPPLMKFGVPVVVADAVPPLLDVDAVSFDNQEGGYLAARELVERGARRTLFLALSYPGEDFLQPTQLNCYRGVEDYCSLNARPPPVLQKIDALKIVKGTQSEEIKRIHGLIKRDQFDGLVVSTDSLLDFARAVAHGLKLPMAVFSEGAGLSGMGDFIQVKHDIQSLGYEAGRMLAQRIEAPFADRRRQLLQVKLISPAAESVGRGYHPIKESVRRAASACAQRGDIKGVAQ